MDIYTQKSRWKIYLGIAGVLIVALSMAYTNYLANMLTIEERNKVDNWGLAQDLINDTDDEELDNLILPYTSNCWNQIPLFQLFG